MNEQVKKLWLDALRSGKYKQTRGKLRRNRGKDKASFCCLGVLCNLHAEAHPEIAAKETDPKSYMGEKELPPVKVQEWAGLDNRDPLVIVGRGWPERPSRISTLNDCGYTFKQIADLIEKQL